MLIPRMDYRQIGRLSALIEPDREFAVSLSHRIATPEGRFLFYYQSPDFLWRMARSMANREQAFPVWPEGDLKWLWRAWTYLMFPGRWDDEDSKAVGLALSFYEQGKGMREKLQALLLAQDATVEKVARLCNLPREVVAAFEALFWNLRDRRQDMLMLSQVVYPDTRLAELLPSYFEEGNLGEILKRMGFNKSLREVLWFAGMSRSYDEEMDMATASKYFQRELLVAGWLLASNGFLNHARPHSTLSASRGLIQAAKIGGVDDSGVQDTTIFEELIRGGLTDDALGIRQELDRTLEVQASLEKA
jgi:hypothetical protein